MYETVVTLSSEDETDQLGAALARALRPGSVVSLIGTLGAGKTRLVQAIAAELGTPREDVTSPTFVIVNEYTTGRLPVFHFDAYRLRDEDEFLQLGPEEYFDASGLTLVEWGDRVEACLPRDCVRVQIEVTGATDRRVTIRDSANQLSAPIAHG